MSQKGKLNTEEKVEIIKKYRQGEISLVQAARDAGVGTTTIYRWSARYEEKFEENGCEIPVCITGSPTTTKSSQLY